LHWGHEEIISLSSDEREKYVRLLIEQLEREKHAVEKSRRDRKSAA
jgi:hypothetical protein